MTVETVGYWQPSTADGRGHTLGWEPSAAPRATMPTPAEPTEHAPHGQPVPLWSKLRYDQLLRYVRRKPSLSILEIGVARAANTLRLMAYADAIGGRPWYSGIDLFGSLTDSQLQDSFCNDAKRPLSREQTMEMLREVLGPEISLRIMLFEGPSSEVLPVLRSQAFLYDLIFIDGGHSYPIVSSDWQHCQHLITPQGVIVFDDFPNWGVPGTIAGIDRREWNVNVLDHVDVFHNHRTDEDPAPFRMHQLVEVTRRAA